MRLATEFVRLPYRFDVERLRQEVLAFDESEWLPHVQGYVGNSAIPLISLHGHMNDDFNGPMAVTEKLQKSPYIKQVLASFDEVFGRSRLMGLAANCSVPEHRDVNYHWYSRVRIHIPIITDHRVLFYCGPRHVHMAAGETWIFDSWRRHRVENGSALNRVHLVIDTAGSSKFWQTVGASEWRCSKQLQKRANIDDRFIAFEEGKEVTILTERFNAPLVMHPGELDALITDIVFDMRALPTNPGPALLEFEMSLQEFRFEWRRTWLLFGQSQQGWPHFEKLIREVRIPHEQILLASNHGSATHTFRARVLAAALNTSLALQYMQS
ncbi:MAG: aspartyl/asparaginyl beta-hydroxylase domain-containing protein [Gammaproteobacteria bacterium]|nr:aspartyl/asparaginyl beta-hydroxylase domain-containing protein [Gammaproteobacteria bacterium]